MQRQEDFPGRVPQPFSGTSRTAQWPQLSPEHLANHSGVSTITASKIQPTANCCSLAIILLWLLLYEHI